MIKGFEKHNGVICKAPYVSCFVDGQSFKARIDTGADISVIPNQVLPIGVTLKNPITIRTGINNIDKIWTKDVEIKIPELGIFRPLFGVLSSDFSTGLIGMDILGLCELQMVGGVFILNVIEVKDETYHQ